MFELSGSSRKIEPSLFRTDVLPNRSCHFGKNETVIVVEDEAVIALDMADDLQTWSYDVVGVGRSLKESLEIAERCPPSLAIVDVALSSAHDGIAVAETLKSRFGTKIIFLTAHTDKATRSRILAAEPRGYLFKPYSAYALRSLLETFESE